MSEELTDREIMLLGKLWACQWQYGWYGWRCLQCNAGGDDKLAVKHQPGCVFHNLPRDVVAAISADWTPA